jgi:hypothetical protein
MSQYYQSSISFLDAMKRHSCKHKELLASDDPRTDLWAAAVEGRKPKVYPKIGYTCQGCEKMFQMEMRHMKIEGLNPIISS